jgi:hypothetical protein
VSITGFGLVIGFIDHVQVVAANKNKTLADFHNTNHFTINVLILSLVFVAVLNNGF